MRLQNLDLDEIGPFYESLTSEKQYIENPLEFPLEFVVGVRVDGELVGIGGLKRHFRLAHFIFFVVKAEFQRRGFASEIMDEILRYARHKRYSLVLSTSNKENPGSVAIFHKCNFRKLHEKGNLWRWGLCFDRKGRVMLKFMPIAFEIRSYAVSLKEIFLR